MKLNTQTKLDILVVVMMLLTAVMLIVDARQVKRDAAAAMDVVRCTQGGNE